MLSFLYPFSLVKNIQLKYRDLGQRKGGRAHENVCRLEATESFRPLPRRSRKECAPMGQGLPGDFLSDFVGESAHSHALVSGSGGGSVNVNVNAKDHEAGHACNCRSQ